ncbi:MAG: CobW family GTP-binding protein [Candidatus Borkfalkiaceae bacterium]|nr:CobW family GTP-binding protein [Christensenellaceae bacterium]
MIKIDVISGFLGAGKTTLIKKLFASDLKNEKVVLIENEFGEIGVDGAFLKDSGVQIKEINSGCICCSLVGDFSKSMKEIVEKFNPDRIIIEPSGVGKLSDIIKAIEKVEEPLKINIVATVVDGGKCKMYFKNFGEFYDDQIKQANTVIVSKTDKLSEEKILAAVELIKSLNPHATIVTTPVTELEPDKLLGILEGDVDNVDALLESLKAEQDDDDDDDDDDCCCHHHHDDDEEHDHHHHHHHDDDEDDDDHDHCCHHHHDVDDDDDDHDHCCHHHHDDDEEHEHHHHHHHGHDADEVFTSWGEETPVAFSHNELDAILKKLCDEDSGLGVILRSKGVVKAKDNEKWYYFDLVAGEYEIRLGDPDYTGKVCVIGSKIDEEKIAALFFGN